MTNAQYLWIIIAIGLSYAAFIVWGAPSIGRFLKRRREAVEAETSLARSLDMETELAAGMECDLQNFIVIEGSDLGARR